ncbi:MAG: hypothetical protein J7K87_02065 [Candidatus Aenigmarchaeota archaeon]|nr:hypothetical protein [Candidatus Aenigmarchaeota archaeon]
MKIRDMTYEDVKRISDARFSNWKSFSQKLIDNGLSSALKAHPGSPKRDVPDEIKLNEDSEVKITMVGTGGAGWVIGRYNELRGSGGFAIEYGDERNKIQIYVDPGKNYSRDAPNYIDVNSIDGIICTHIHPDHAAELVSALQDASLNAKRRGGKFLALNKTALTGAGDAKGTPTDKFHTKLLMGETYLMTGRDQDEVENEVENTPYSWFDGIKNEIEYEKNGLEIKLKATKSCHQETGASNPEDVFGFILETDNGTRVGYTSDTRVWEKEIGQKIDTERRTITFEKGEAPEKLIHRDDIISQYKDLNVLIANPAAFTPAVYDGKIIDHDNNHMRVDGVVDFAKKSGAEVVTFREIAAENYRIGPEARKVLGEFGHKDFIDFGIAYLEEFLPNTKIAVLNDGGRIVA